MANLQDARTNEWQGALDAINAITYTDARTQTNSLSSLNASVSVDINGKATMMVHINVTVAFNAATTLIIEGTVDGTNFFQLPFFVVQAGSTGMAAAETISNIVPGSTGTGHNLVCVSTTGFRQMRVRMNAFTTAGTAVIALRATMSDYRIYAQPQPAVLGGTANSVTNSAQTLIAAPAAGLFVYITSLHIMQHATAAVTAATPVFLQLSNLFGASAMTSRFPLPNLGAVGQMQTVIDQTFPTPLKAFAAATAVQCQTSAAPAANSIITVTASGYVGA